MLLNTLIATIVGLFLAPTLPQAPIPKAKPKFPQVGPIAPGILDNFVSAVPKPPKGLKWKLAYPLDFHSDKHRSNPRAIELRPNQYRENGTKMFGQIVATATVRVPQGATVSWLDCRVESDASDPAVPAASFTAQVIRYDYSEQIRSNDYQVSSDLVKIRFPRSKARKTGTYWNGKVLKKPLKIGPDQMLTLRVSMLSWGNPAGRTHRQEFLGCRVGYKKK